MRDYLKSLSSSALPSMLDSLGWRQEQADWFKICLTGIAFMLTAILALSAMALGKSALGIILLLGLILALPILFIWHLFVAAFDLHESLHAECEGLKKPARHYDELVARKLRALLDQGNELIAGRPTAEKSENESVWIQNLLSWCTSAQELVTKNLPRSEAVGFMTISLFPSVDQSSAELERILRTRLDILRRITTRYLEFAS